MRLFSPVERLLAKRYMRSRRAEGFISVIAWFSLAGITLGVATLIIVMSVMNGFRAELIGRILGLNGHVGVYAAGGSGIADFDPLSVETFEPSDSESASSYKMYRRHEALHTKQSLLKQHGGGSYLIQCVNPPAWYCCLVRSF